MKLTGLLTLTLAATLALPCLAATGKKPNMNENKPKVIVLTAFGTSSRAEAVYGEFEKKVLAEFPQTEVRWAFTSSIIRGIVNKRLEKAGNNKRLKSLGEALDELTAEGFREVVVQPLHIFPGEEYDEVAREVDSRNNLEIALGETLLHRWSNVREVIETISGDFLGEDEGVTLLAAHGTPTTASPANTTLLGLEKMLATHGENLLLCTVDGLIEWPEVKDRATGHPSKRARIIPFMFVGGKHVEEDLLGTDPEWAEESWKHDLDKAGFNTDILTVEVSGRKLYKGLGSYSGVTNLFTRSIRRALGNL